MNRSNIFLKCYAETGSITKAALAADISRAMHYRRMKTDEAYRLAFEDAHELAIAVLEDEAIRRAVHGVDEPVTYKGMLTYLPELDEKGRPVYDEDGGMVMSKKPLAIRKYSDQLLQFLLRGAKPEKYRERFDHSGTVDHNHKFSGTLEELLATYRNLTKADPGQPETA